jgi:hypothetical protein
LADRLVIRFHLDLLLFVLTQLSILFMLYFSLPDYPAKNKHLSYFQILFSMAKVSRSAAVSLPLRPTSLKHASPRSTPSPSLF